MRRVQAQPYFQPVGEPDRFLPEGPRAVRRGSREGVAWVNIQRGPDSAYGSLLFYDPEGPWEGGDPPGPTHRLDCPGRPGFLRPMLLVRRPMAPSSLDLLLACRRDDERPGCNRASRQINAFHLSRVIDQSTALQFLSVIQGSP